MDAARLILTAIVLWLLAGCCTGVSVARGQLVKRAIGLPISVSQLQAIEQVCIVKLSCRRVGKIINGSILPYFRSISALMLDFNAIRAPNNTDAETNLSDRVKKCSSALVKIAQLQTIKSLSSTKLAQETAF